MWTLCLHLILASLSLASDLCDFTLGGGVCLYDGTSVLMPNSIPTGLQGHWTFDDGEGLDYSGNENHAATTAKVGHSMGGQGSSARFIGDDYVEIPHADSISSEIFSVTFWMFLNHKANPHSGLRWCPLLQKGQDSEDTYERAPAVFFDRHTRGLKVYVSTGSDDFPQGEYVQSNARLAYGRWNAIGVVRSQSNIYLYVNGILDNSNSTTDWTETNESPLFVGNTPETLDECPVALLVDELRYYNSELSEADIEALAMGALSQIEPHFVKLGCVDCSLLDAAEACQDEYHLCTSIELHSGAYSVARVNGWTELNPQVWAYSALSYDVDEDVLGLGLCCYDLD